MQSTELSTKEPLEPTEDQLLQLMHADERRTYSSADVPASQKEAIREFHRTRWKAQNMTAEATSDVTERSGTPEAWASVDPRTIDASYSSFPTFAEWVHCSVDTSRWDEHLKALSDIGSISPSMLRRAREVVTRAAAIDTGALEQLYDVDRGFTFTVATQAATWEAVLDKKGAEIRALIESQMAAYEMVLDFATQKQLVAEAWIRELHAELCKSQKTYSALTEVGWQELELPRGKYKTSPNHVLGRDGEIHAYAPVDRTPSEMQRLVTELRSDEFLAAHPVLQASYAHYAFVVIHPFADGNGRVARALASVYTYRANSIPLLILSENRNIYIDSLTAADKRNYQPFVDFVFERCLDAIRLTATSLYAADAPPLEFALESYKNVHLTKGGYTHEQVDLAGYALANLMVKEIEKQGRDISEEGGIAISVENRVSSEYKISSEKMRHPFVSGGRRLVLRVEGNVGPPENSKIAVVYYFNLEVPRNSDLEDEVFLFSANLKRPLSARMTELLPTASVALQLRISIHVRAVLGVALEALTSHVRAELSKKGLL